MNLQDSRTVIESVHSWANELHAQYTREDRINPDMGPYREERKQIESACMSMMLSCTDILGDLEAIEEAKDEMDAAGRDNFKRDV